jgi:hypothetical protein
MLEDGSHLRLRRLSEDHRGERCDDHEDEDDREARERLRLAEGQANHARPADGERRADFGSGSLNRRAHVVTRGSSLK